MLSTLYINDFNLYGRTYRVQAEAQSRFRQSPEDIGRLFVRAEDSDNKEMIPLSALTTGRVPRRRPACSPDSTGSPPPW